MWKGGVIILNEATWILSSGRFGKKVSQHSCIKGGGMIPSTPVHLHTIRMKLKMQVLHEKKRRKIWAWKRQQPLRIESSCTGMPEWGDWGGYTFTTNRCDIEETWMNATNFHFTHAVTVPSGAVVCSITIASSISRPLDFQDILCLKWFATSQQTPYLQEGKLQETNLLRV